MRGIVFRGNRKLEILDFDDPTPGPRDAVIAIKASGMCGSDLHFYRNNPAEVLKSLGFKDMASRGMAEDTPIIAGHEPCGEIIGACTRPRGRGALLRPDCCALIEALQESGQSRLPDTHLRRFSINTYLHTYDFLHI